METGFQRIARVFHKTSLISGVLVRLVGSVSGPTGISKNGQSLASARSVLLIVATICTPINASSVDRSLPVISSTAELRALPLPEARRGYPVGIEGVVLYADAQSHILWLHDATGMQSVELPEGSPEPQAGDLITLQGRSGVQGTKVKILEPSLTIQGTGELPAPKSLPYGDIMAGKVPAYRVHFTGVIHSLNTTTERLHLEVMVEKRFRIWVIVKEYAAKDLARLVDATVEVTGVPDLRSDPEEGFAPVQVFVPRLADVVVFGSGSADPFSVPLVEIGTVADRFRKARELRRLKVRGKVLTQEFGRSLRIEDRTGVITIRSLLQTRAQTGDLVEVVGFPWQDSEDSISLERAVFRIVDAGNPTPAAPKKGMPLLRQVQAIRALTPEEATRQYPVEINATVTYYDSRWRVFFVQDSTAGIYVRSGEQQFHLVPGDRVKISGHTDPGGYAPLIELSHLVVTGKGELPEARNVSFGQLLTGSEDSQWVELTGMVRSLRNIDRHLQIELAGSRALFTAVIPGWDQRPLPNAWVGSLVRLRGVCGVKTNTQRQMLGIYLHVPGEDFIEFVQPLVEDPFSLPETPIAQLLRFSPVTTPEQLVKVSGIVVYRDATGLTALQDAESGMFVRLVGDKAPQLGDRVEVLGFPTVGAGAYSPTLEYPRWRTVDQPGIPPAEEVVASELEAGSHDGRRVALEARLLENLTESARPSLTLQANQTVFNAMIEGVENDASLSALRKGSILRVSGVCQVHLDTWSRPKAFGLLVARPEQDILLVRQPPWLRRGHVLLAAGVLAVTVLSALVWVASLRRKVKQQTLHIQDHYEQQVRLQERYRDLFENASDIIFTLNDEGRFTSLNHSAEKAFGAPREELLQTSLYDKVDGQCRPRLREVLQRLAEGEVAPTIELTVRGQDGQDIIMETTTRAIRRVGDPIGYQCIARDVAERRQLEAQLRQMQKMESIGQLAAGVAHDYNNLMTIVIGHTEMLLADSVEPWLAESLQEVAQAAHRAADLTRQLLAFSRRQLMSPKSLDLNKTVRDLSKMLGRLLGEHIALTCDLTEESSFLMADIGMLEQVIVNLAVNARDAMPEGGMLHIGTVVTRVDDTHTRRNSEARPGEFVCLVVRDAGIGMDAYTLARAFEPFFTTKEVGKGTGLGLSTVFGIVKQHEGWIEAESEPDSGSTFRVFFPRCPEHEPLEQARPKKTAATGNETVLAVEDEPQVLQLLVDVLERTGYRVHSAGNGPDALVHWQRHQGQIDLLVTDMVMPGGMTGTQLARRLRQDQPDLKIVYCSGYSTDLFAIAGSLRPGEAILPKPFVPFTLTKTVRDCLDDKPPVP